MTKNKTKSVSVGAQRPSGVMEESEVTLLDVYNAVMNNNKRLDDFYNELENLKNFQSSLCDTNACVANLEAENKLLKQVSNDCWYKLNELDQYSRNKNMEIHGIQERHGEDLVGLTLEMAKHLHISCSENDIDVLHRVPTRNPRNRKPILVQFTTRKVRNAFLEKRVTGLTSNNLVGGSDDTKIFINENLTDINRDLAWRCRAAKRSLNYRFCWVKNGRVFLRKSSDSPVIHVKSVADIPEDDEVQTGGNDASAAQEVAIVGNLSQLHLE